MGSKVTAFEIHELHCLVSQIKAEEIMTKKPITVPLDFTIEETAEILQKNLISGVPIVDHNDNLVGTIT